MSFNRDNYLDAYAERCVHTERTKAGCRLCYADLCERAFRDGEAAGRSEAEELAHDAAKDEWKHLERLADDSEPRMIQIEHVLESLRKLMGARREERID